MAARIKSVLQSIISDDQSGFFPGRFIGDNIRLPYDIMYYTEENNIPEIILLVDFSIRFESISWDFMYHASTFFNFGHTLIQWITLFYNITPYTSTFLLRALNRALLQRVKRNDVKRSDSKQK